MIAWAEAVAAADATVELVSVLDALVLEEVRFWGESAGRVPFRNRPEGRAEAEELALDDDRLDELLLGAAEDEALLEGEGELLLDEDDEGEGEGEGDSELDEGSGGGDHVDVDVVEGGGVQVLVDGSGGGVHVLVSGSGVQVLVGLGSSLVVGLGFSPPPPPPKFQLIWNTPLEWGAPRASNSDGDRSRSPYEHVGHESTIVADWEMPVSVFVIDT